jgi:hypothetical protein
MRGRMPAGIIAALVVVAGVVSMAQGPPELSPLPLPPSEEAKAADAPSLPGTAELPPAVVTTDDPMQAVEAFLQRNRKEADEAIKALTQERDSLRARLQKVEAALGRWKAVAGALEHRQVDEPPIPPLPPEDNAPGTPQPANIIAPTVPAP